MDDPGWRRGLLVMVAVTAVGGLSFPHFGSAFGPGAAFVAPFAWTAGVGAVLRGHARVVEWSDYGRGLRDGFWGGLATLAVFLGYMLMLSWPYL